MVKHQGRFETRATGQYSPSPLTNSQSPPSLEGYLEKLSNYQGQNPMLANSVMSLRQRISSVEPKVVYVYYELCLQDQLIPERLNWF